MLKTKKIARVLCVVLCLCVFLCACEKTPDPTTTGPTQAKEAIHTITITTNGCAIPRNVTVYVYDSVEKTELIDFGSLDANGQFTFTDLPSDKYVAVLQGVPVEGYGLQEYYPLTGTKTEIKLNGGVVTGKDPLEQGKMYRVGNFMRDFTVTTSDGQELTLSKLLEEKKAVMLNFWYTNCQPCQNEFPNIQQAYELFQDDIEIIAMNPTGEGNSAIENFKNKMGLTFPMADVDAAWAQAIGISGYPTTIIIDRYGMICLKETGVDNIVEGLFEGVFSYFASDDYEQKTINSILELNNYEFPLGSKNNPYETHGEAGEFEVTIAPETEVYSLVYKANNVTIRIENPNVYLVYGNERFDPDENGVVEVVVSSPDSMTGASLIIGNTGDEEITVKAAVIPEDNTPQGTADKPFPMEMGPVSVDIAAGNEQGVFYTVTATEAGILKVVVTGVTEGAGYDVQLYNLTTMAQRNLQEEELVDENGNAYVTVDVNAGDVVRVGFMTLMDNATSQYPAANIQALVSVSEDEGSGSTDVTYTITVKDEEGNPMAGVSASVTVDGVPTTLESNEEGIISIVLPAGNYTVKLTVPEGYEATTTQYLLTANNPNREVVLQNVVLKEYTYVVHVQDRAGNPIANVSVVIGDSFVRTNANGDASFVLLEGNYTASIVAPNGYIADTTTFSFGEETSLTIVLARADGMDSQAEYTVTVVDPDGNPFTDVMVRFEGEKGSPVVAAVDANGTVTKKLDRDNYNVVLVFSGKTMDYEKCNAKLTLTDTSVVIEVAPIFKGETKEIWPVIMDDSCVGYVVGLGGTYVEVAPNGLTYFVFTPDQDGVYKITTTNPAALIENWNNIDFTTKMEFGVENNVLTLEVNGVGADYVFAVNAGENVDGTILKITREANVQAEPEVEIYQGTHTPNGKYVANLGAGQTFLDLAAQHELVKDADGFYHLGSVDGPIVMLDLDATRYGINIAELLDRGAMLKYEYDADGKPVKRIDYTDCMNTYLANKDENHGVYALTDDLITILQGHGETAGWYDVTSENYLFVDSEVPAANAWMFLLCIAA